MTHNDFRGSGGVRAVVLAAALLLSLLLLRPAVVGADGELQVQIHSVDDSGEHPFAIVTVLDASGRPVIGLGADQFRLEAEGNAARILDVSTVVNSEIGAGVVLTIDASGSMEGSGLESARESAQAFLAALPATDQAAVITFSSEIEVLQEMTADIAALNAALEGIEAGGGTALYDAVIESVRTASASAVPRKAVVLLSDGFDFPGSSEAKPEEALAEAAASGVPIYTIGFGDSIDEPFLRALAEQTNGRHYVTPSAADLVTAYEELGALLRSQYVIAYEADTPLAVRERTVRLTIESEQGSGSVAFSYTSLAPLPVAPAPPVSTPAAVVRPPLTLVAPAAPAPDTAGSGGVAPLWPVALVTLVAGAAVFLFVRHRRRGARIQPEGGATPQLDLNVPPPQPHAPTQRRASLSDRREHRHPRQCPSVHDRAATAERRDCGRARARLVARRQADVPRHQWRTTLADFRTGRELGDSRLRRRHRDRATPPPRGHRPGSGCSAS